MPTVAVPSQSWNSSERSIVFWCEKFRGEVGHKLRNPWRLMALNHWGVVSNIFYSNPYLGEDSYFDYIIFFKWVETWKPPTRSSMDNCCPQNADVWSTWAEMRREKCRWNLSEGSLSLAESRPAKFIKAFWICRECTMNAPFWLACVSEFRCNSINKKKID